jgi:hypothetical protein
MSHYNQVFDHYSQTFWSNAYYIVARMWSPFSCNISSNLFDPMIGIWHMQHNAMIYTTSILIMLLRYTDIVMLTYVCLLLLLSPSSQAKKDWTHICPTDTHTRSNPGVASPDTFAHRIASLIYYTRYVRTLRRWIETDRWAVEYTSRSIHPSSSLYVLHCVRLPICDEPGRAVQMKDRRGLKK